MHFEDGDGNKVTPKEHHLRNEHWGLSFAQHQWSKELPNKEHTALYTDETTKLGEKYAGYHDSNKEDNMFVLGLRSISTKSANDTLTGLKQILDDINEKSRLQEDITKKKILYNIMSTM